MKTSELYQEKENDQDANLKNKDLNQPKDMFYTTNNLTSPNAIDITIHRIYFSNRCKFFYVLLIIPSIITLFFLVYFLLSNSPKEVPFIIIFLEWILNTVIVIDILFRIRLMGFYKFLRMCKIDLILTILCLFSFFLALISFVNSWQFHFWKIWFIDRYYHNFSSMFPTIDENCSILSKNCWTVKFTRYKITHSNENPIAHLSSIDREKSPGQVKNYNLKEEKFYKKKTRKRWFIQNKLK